MYMEGEGGEGRVIKGFSLKQIIHFNFNFITLSIILFAI